MVGPWVFISHICDSKWRNTEHNKRWVLDIRKASFKKFTNVKKSDSVASDPNMTGDLGSIAGLGRSPGEGNGNPVQYSCLENATDRRAWRATVRGVSESDTTE